MNAPQLRSCLYSAHVQNLVLTFTVYMYCTLNLPVGGQLQNPHSSIERQQLGGTLKWKLNQMCETSNQWGRALSVQKKTCS